MGLLSIFKKIFHEERKKEAVERKIMTIDKLSQLVSSEHDKKIELRKGIKNSVIKEITQFDMEISPQIILLEELNLDERKENEKLKQVVRENLKQYLAYLNKLNNDLKNIENIEPEEYVKKVELILRNFNKISKNSFEKATILIGDELEKAREIIGNLLKSLDPFMQQYKKLSEDIEKTDKILDLYIKIREIDKNNEEFEENIEKCRKNISKIKEDKEKADEDISEIKDSSEYKKSIEEKAMFQQELENAEKEMQELKEKIDFRELAKHFHDDEKKMRLIKKYAENFKEALDKDENLEIASLAKDVENLDISGLDNLRKRMKEMKDIPESEIDKKIDMLVERTNKLDFELSANEKEISDLSSKIEKLKDKKEELKAKIKDDSEKIFQNIYVE